MQQSTTHSPLDVATGLPWQEQLLIRLDEIVGLLDSVNSRLEHWEEDREDRYQVLACLGYSIPDTGHLDTPNLSSDSNPPSPDVEEPPQ